MTRVLTGRGRRLVLAGMVAALAGSVAGVAAYQEAPLGTLDRAVVEYAFYDAATGEALYASNHRMVQERAARLGQAAPPEGGVATFGTSAFPVGKAATRSEVTNVLAAYLEGRRVGDLVATEVFPRGFGAWEREVALPLELGPFPLAHEHPRAAFEQRYGEAAPGVTLRDDRVTDALLEVTAVTEEAVRYRAVLSDGQQLALRKLDWPAVADVDEAAQTFRLRMLPPPAGALGPLACTNPAVTAITGFNLTGSYRILDVGEDEVRFAFSSFQWPLLVERAVVVEMRVLEIQRLGGLLGGW